MDKRYTRKAISERIRVRMQPAAGNNGGGDVIHVLIQRAQQLRQMRTGIPKTR